MISSNSVNCTTTFTRQGSQVQSLYRPPVFFTAFNRLRSFLSASRKSWGQTGVEPTSSPLPPRAQRTENVKKRFTLGPWPIFLGGILDREVSMARMAAAFLVGYCFLSGCAGSGNAPVQIADAHPVPAMTTRSPPAAVLPVVHAPAPVEGLIVFTGDSITACWDTLQPGLCDYQTPQTLLSTVLPGAIDVAIGGETSQYTQAHFDDVLSLKPATVVILVGTNDIRYNSSTDQSALFAMVTASQAAGARVVVGTLPPNTGWLFANEQTQGEQMYAQWNDGVRRGAKAYGYVVADYCSAMLNPDGTQNASLFIADGTHPNPAGYAVMWSVLAPLLKEDLQ